jgi:hypothetical protein
MKRPVVNIIIGILIIIMGLRDNEYKIIPQVLYFVFGGIAILIGFYKLLTSEPDDNKDAS